MKKMLNEATKVLAALLMLFAPNLMAQERLVPMRGNPSLAAYDDYVRAEKANPSRAAGDTLSLPFFDDFSEPFSRLRTAADMYPNSDLWINNKVYINNHMAINPISQGVATFDGLDERGRAYGFLFQGQNPSPQPADTLTSKPLDLSNAADTVYLSFYYQPQGIAPYAPGEQYKLMLQFKDTADLWETQWEAEGFELEVFDFNRAMIPVTDGKHLYSGFQFRFVNLAFLGGNVDQWHVDYIELDEGRTLGDTLIDDVSILGQTSVDFNGIVRNMTSSILKEYNNMPWMHYKENPTEFMGDTAFFVIRNNTNELMPSGKYTMQIFNAFSSLLYTSAVASPQVLPSIICGNEGNDCASATEPDLLYRALDFEYPTNVALSSDSMFFELVHNINELSDDVATNDRTSFKQEFYNYYAYDDGTAEAAYGLENLDSESMVALKYHIKKADNLVAIQYYLNPVEFNVANESIRLVIWTGNEEPEEIKWQSPDTNLYYTNQHNYFHHYTLPVDSIIPVAADGNIWIGWVQQPSTNPDFGYTFGFDKRTDASNKLFYNIGSTWNQSSIPGAVMLRPVFGEPYNWVGVDEKPTVEHIKVYPNPTTGDVYLEEAVTGQFRNAQISVFDLSGRSVYTTAGYTGKLQLAHLTAGTYLLRIDAASGVFTERLVLQP